MTGEEQYRWSYETQTSADGARAKSGTVTAAPQDLRGSCF